MLSPQEVACNFIPAYFECLASHPEDLADMYSQHSSFVIVDFEYGTKEASGAEVPQVIERLAQILEGCEMSVESYTAVPLYGGVSVYTTMSAESKTTRHYFQFVTILESCGAVAYGSEAYFIRHQIVIRPGAAEKEQPAVEATPEPPVEEKLEPVPASEPAAVVEQQQQQKEGGEEEEKKTAEEAPAAKDVTPPAAEPAAAPAPQRPSSKPKSWASLASAAPKGEQRQPLKIISHVNGASPEAADAPAAAAAATTTATGAKADQHHQHQHQHQQQQQQQATGPKPHPKAPRAPPVAIGDRLMFSIDHAVSDEEIKAAFGPLAAHIVSLRNNSTNGHVFIDFSEKEKVYDALKANPPTVGARKTPVNVYRQRTRQ